MGKLRTALHYMPKRVSALVAMVAAAAIVPAMLFAWGPTRQTYTIEHPADHVTFNSITNNPNIGDERNFVGIRDASDTTGTWSDSVTAQPGKSYVVRMYVHNNAASNLNLVAKDVTAKFTLPTTTAKSIQVNGFLDSSNASPKEVYDDATFKSDQNFNLAYQTGTLKYFNNHFGANGTALPESAFTSAGAKLGYDKLDGNIPGCFQYAGYLTFVVKPQFATPPTSDFTVKKEVRKDGAAAFAKTTDAKPGDKLNYRLNYTNTGDTAAKQVVMKDTLPKGITPVAGSVKILNATSPNGAVVTDGEKLFASGGLNIGDYTANGSNAYVIFDATVDSNDKLPVCGPNKIHNVVSVQPQGQNPKDDSADVTVPKECQPDQPPQPSYTCDALTVTKIDRTHFTFATKYTLKNATYKNTTYVIKDSTGKELSRSSATSYTQATAGDYSVQAIVTVTVDGQDKTVTSDACAKQFTVTPPTPPEECKPGVPVGDKDCEEKPPVEECKPGIPVGDDRCDEKPPVDECKPGVPTDSKDCDEKPPVDECKPGIPTGSKDCKENCTVPGKEDLPKDSADCVETPVTPPVTPPATPTAPAELPHTGTSDAVVAFLGAGSLIAAIGYYIASRRATLS